MPRAKKVIVTEPEEIQPLAAPEVEPIAIESELVEEKLIPSESPEVIATPPVKEKKSRKSSKTVPTPTVLPETSEVPAPVKVRKPKFKEIHIKDNYWVENDVYQTIADMTKGNKGAKALIINQALKDYFKKNKIDIVPFVDKEKHKKS